MENMRFTGSISDMADAIQRAIVPMNGVSPNAPEPKESLHPALNFPYNPKSPAEGSKKSDLAYEKAYEALEEAYEGARQVRVDAMAIARQQLEKAEEQSVEILRRAREQAADIRSQAQADAAAVVQQARQQAEHLVIDARETRNQIIGEANANAERILAEARRQAEETHNAAAAAMQQAIEYRNELKRLEAQFDAVAREFVKWLGMPVEAETGWLRRIAREQS